ncbi:MAG: hypothetical protein AB8B87_10805 [Granulosicoccus sp.]
MYHILVISSLLLSSMLPGIVSANQADKALSLLNLPIGEQRQSTVSAAEQQWESQAICETIRTGVGLTRRAYFLETCVFTNAAGHTLYDETLSTATYRFLESQLVQVSYEFTQINDPEKFNRCVQQETKKLDSRQSQTDTSSKSGITVDKEFTVSVSNVELVEQIHVLQDAP